MNHRLTFKETLRLVKLDKLGQLYYAHKKRMIKLVDMPIQVIQYFICLLRTHK